MEFRELRREECKRIKEIDASQMIGRAWRLVEGERQLIEINYFDPDWPNGYEEHVAGLEETLDGDGLVLGAFDEERLIGVVSVNRDFIGQMTKHVLLDQLFISKEMRSQGLGRQLFFAAAKEAKSWGAEKFYICAGSAEETIAFYRAIGCQDAMEVIQALAEEDPRDLQLEYDLAKI